VIDTQDPEKFAFAVRDLLIQYNENNKSLIANYFKQTHGVQVSVETIKYLFDILKSTKRSEYKGKIEGLMKKWQQGAKRTTLNQKA
jgi:hypothetical protein